MAGAAPSARPAPFKPFLDTLDRGVLLAESALSLVVIVAMLFVSVVAAIARFVQAAPWLPAATREAMARSAWLHSADDVLLQGAIWAAFLGASFATRGRKHLAIDVLGRLLPERGRHIVVAVATTLGAVIALALARGIFGALNHAAVDADEQLANLVREGATRGEVDRGYQFQYVIPAGFLLIAIRLTLHSFHEFVAAFRGDPPTASTTDVAELPYREPGANVRDVVEPKSGSPADQATLAEIVIALVALLAIVVLARGSTVLGSLAFCATMSALVLVVPLALRYRRRRSWAPTVARERDPEVAWTLGSQLGALACVLLLDAVAGYGFTHMQYVPIAWGVAFFALMAVLGAPLFTFLGGLALFLWLHGSADVAAAPLYSAVEDALGPHFARMSVLPTIPVFTLAGYLMSESRTPQRLVRLARAWLGWAPGGLAIVCLLTSSLFTVFSGASGITIVAIGGLLYPALIRDKYPERFSLGLVTTGGALGITLPFCLPMIVYGIVAGLQQPPPGQERLELQKFLFAGLLPGALAVGLFIIVAVVVALVAKVPRSHTLEFREAWAALWDAKWELAVVLFLPVGLYYLGPTTAAVLTAFYVLVIEVFVYKDLSLTRDVPRIIPESMILVGAIFVKLCAATILTAYFIQAQTADHLFESLTCGPPAQAYLHAHSDTLGSCREAVDALASLHRHSGGLIDSRITFLLALNVFLLIVGMLMDIFSAIVVVVPLIAGIALHFNINPYHLGVVFLFNLEIGYLMPPMGLNLFIAAFRFNRPVPELYRVVPGFIGVFIVALMIVTYWPALTLVAVPGQHADAVAVVAPTPVIQAAVRDAGVAEADAGNCDEPGENESFDDFNRRCHVTTPAAETPVPTAAPDGDCDAPRENEAFADFDRRCHITADGGA